MESNTGSSKVSKCYICEDNIQERKQMYVYTCGAGEIVSLCQQCGFEFDRHIDLLKHRAKEWTDKKIKEWVKKQQVVKRFDKRQHKLPLDGGDGDEGKTAD